jgi:hypothetical protein
MTGGSPPPRASVAQGGGHVVVMPDHDEHDGKSMWG